MQKNLDNEISPKTASTWAWVKKQFPLWSPQWIAEVFHHAEMEGGVFRPLNCRDLETWVRWNCEAADKKACTDH
jgi:hypothetical protein|tara:strand:+ start:277 stop:498 length:222 start_codon:yes stop_codon:yes gene_type:complete